MLNKDFKAQKQAKSIGISYLEFNENGNEEIVEILEHQLQEKIKMLKVKEFTGNRQTMKAIRLLTNNDKLIQKTYLKQFDESNLQKVTNTYENYFYSKRSRMSILAVNHANQQLMNITRTLRYLHPHTVILNYLHHME